VLSGRLGAGTAACGCRPVAAPSRFPLAAKRLLTGARPGGSPAPPQAGVLYLAFARGLRKTRDPTAFRTPLDWPYFYFYFPRDLQPTRTHGTGDMRAQSPTLLWPEGGVVPGPGRHCWWARGVWVCGCGSCEWVAGSGSGCREWRVASGRRVYGVWCMIP
jgi:hypothetical protein